MKRHLSILACLLVVLAMVFSMASCDLFGTPDNAGNDNTGDVTPGGDNTGDNEPEAPATAGTAADPHALTVPGTLAVDFAGGLQPVWYAFTATETKTLSITLGSANACMGYGVDAAQITYTNGETNVKVNLTAGVKYYVNFSSLDFEAAQYTVTAEYVASPYEVVIHEGEGNVVTFSPAEVEAGTATRKLVIETGSTYQFAGDIFVAKVVAADDTEIAKVDYAYTLAAGEYIITFDMSMTPMAIVADTGYALEVEDQNVQEDDDIDDPTGSADPLDTEASELVIGYNTVTITDTDIAEGAIRYTIVVTATGTFSVESGYDLGARFFDSEGMPIGYGAALLQPGTYTVAILCASIETAGDYSFDFYFEPYTPSQPGDEGNPFVIDSIPYTITYTGSFDKYYVYTATADCAIVVTTTVVSDDEGMTGYVIINGTYYYEGDVVFVNEGDEVIFNVGAYGSEGDEEEGIPADSFTFEIAFGEYAEAGSQSRPNEMYPDEFFTVEYPGGNDVSKYVWFKANIYDNGYFVITFAERVNALYGTDLDNLSTVMDATTKIEVAYGDTLYLAVQSFDLAEATISFETSWEFAPGSESNPFAAADGENTCTLPGNWTMVWYTYEITANGIVTVVTPDVDGVYFYIGTSTWNVSPYSEPVSVVAGDTIYIYLESEVAAECTFNLAFEEKEIEISGEKVHTQIIATPGDFEKSEEYTFTATEAGVYYINVIGKDASTNFQIYDASGDSWPLYNSFPVEIVLEAGESVKFRLFGWDNEVAGTEVTVEIYYDAEAEVGGEDGKTGSGTDADPYIITAPGDYICAFPGGYNAIWYSFVAETSGTVILSTDFGPGGWLQIGIQPMMMEMNNFGSGESISFAVTAGETYYVAVGDWDETVCFVSFSLAYETAGDDEEDAGNGLEGSGVNTDPYIIPGAGEYTVDAEGTVFLAYINSGDTEEVFTISGIGANYWIECGTFNFMLCDTILQPEAITSKDITVPAGGTLFIKVSTNDGEAGEVSFAIAAPAPVLEETALTLGHTSIEANNMLLAYTADADGMFVLVTEAAVMAPVDITYTINGGDEVVAPLGETTEINLSAGDKLVIKVIAEGYSGFEAFWYAN